jgi:hypothetical protein
LTRGELVSFFESAVGREKAHETIEGMLRAKGLNDEDVPVEQALELLDELTKRGGIFGAVASFAKARVHLRRRE